MRKEIAMVFSVGTLRHEKLRDVHTPHWLAEIEAEICTETEADSKIATHGSDASAHHNKTTVASEISSGTFAEARIPGHMSKNKLALTAGKLLKGAGAGADPVEIDVPGGGIWTLAETLSPSNQSTINSSTFSAHDLWMIILDIWYAQSTSAEIQVELRFNGDSSVAYATRYLDNTTVVVSTGQTRLKIGGAKRTNTVNPEPTFLAVLWVGGKGQEDNGDYGPVGITGIAAPAGSVDFNRILNGSYDLAGATQAITQFNFLLNSNATGKVKIYYMDY